MAFQVAKCCPVTLSQLLPNLEHALAPREQQTTASGLSMQLSVQPVAVVPRCRAHGMYYWTAYQHLLAACLLDLTG